MKRTLETSKFYPCYPIFILAYYSEKGEPLISTMSSSYSLVNKVVLGIGTKSYFIKNIAKNTDFTINFVDSNHLRAIETGGLMSNNIVEDKTLKSNLSFSNSDIINAPYINEASLIFECKVETTLSSAEDQFVTIFAKIVNRLCEDYLVVNNIFQYQKLDIPLFGGDAKSRGYRFMSDIYSKIGSYRKDDK